MKNRLRYWLKKDRTWYIVTFVLLFVLCYLFPYTGDDWSWGSSVGIDRINAGFVDYGGRYFGYIIVLVLTRLRVLKALVMAGTFFGLGWIVKNIVKQKWAFFATILLIFLVGNEIFAQSVAWTSGFSNYATTAIMIVTFLMVVFNIIFEGKTESLWLRIGMFLLGLGGSLIMENVTVFFVMMPILLQIYLWVKEKRFSVALATFAFGAVLGAIFMFTNSAYTNIASAQDGYRTMSFSITELLMRAKENYITAIHPYGLFKDMILVLLLFFGGHLLSNVVIGATYKPKIFLYFEALMSFIAIVSLVVFTISILKDKLAERRMMTVLWLSFAILVGPLFVVTPIGPRNFFSPYILLVIISLMVWVQALEPFKAKKQNEFLPWLEKALRLSAVVVVAVYVCIFVPVYYVDVMRLKTIRKEVEAGKQEVILKRLPFDSLMWVSSPTFDKFTERYKMFYDIPMEVDVVNEQI